MSFSKKEHNERSSKGHFLIIKELIIEFCGNLI